MLLYVLAIAALNLVTANRTEFHSTTSRALQPSKFYSYFSTQEDASSYNLTANCLCPTATGGYEKDSSA